ncbi:uncharacterized protein LOC131215959 [Anopheles bellator]|uniref:uncharacterized protein LOC131215959 n=1 Tax=Anopheles bellator TaxID=139047 RepID=UPI0026475069|nr:uncharacterized protein LOC131215959 [Anopheles bellator]
MFNDRKPNSGGPGFVKAYSNNWLTQLGDVYKYESPRGGGLRKRDQHQHRKIALYSILAMAFVAFFTLFMIVHETERRMRQQVIELSFDNETSIEPSAGGFNTVLTTPLSSGLMNQSVESSESAESSMKRTRGLRYYARPSEGSVAVGRDGLVLLPARFLKPPPVSGEADARSRLSWSGEGEPLTEAEVLTTPESAASRRSDAAAEPKPFHFKPIGPVPVGFQQQPVSSEANHSLADSIQGVIRQLTLAKRQQHQQLHYNYHPYMGAVPLQPSEFNHPVHQNHRIKFTGIYRHPRKNGDITTLFGAASQRPREVLLQPPQLINQQLQQPMMPDALYNFKPHDPSDVNLLATEQFRFAPQPRANGWPREGMPFSVMLNLEPVPAIRQPYQTRPLTKGRRNRFRNPWAPPANEQAFAQLSPYRVRPSGNVYGESAEYEQESYFRRNGPPVPVPAFASPLIGPSRLMVHFNIYPKQTAAVAQRKSEPPVSTELNTGEEQDQRSSTVPTTTPSSTVEVLKSIEIPTQITFDHVPLGRHPPPPRPEHNPWLGDEATNRLWQVRA